MALGGGFARGFAHLGVLSVLEECRIPITAIAGTSIGSVIGAAYAGGISIGDMVALGRTVRFRDFSRRRASRLGLATNEPLGDLMRHLLPANRIEGLRLPLAVVATDIRTGDPVIFKSGDLAEAVRASCAFPGLFEPVEFDGRSLVDGGVVAPVPTQAAATMEASCVVGVSVDFYRWDCATPTNLFQVVTRSVMAAQKNLDASWKRKAALLIEPDLAGFEWNEFARVDEAVAIGAEAARRAMPRLHALLDRRARSNRTAPHFSLPRLRESSRDKRRASQ